MDRKSGFVQVAPSDYRCVPSDGRSSILPEADVDLVPVYNTTYHLCVCVWGGGGVCVCVCAGLGSDALYF